MSFLDELSDAQETPITAYHEFLISSQKYHAFVEEKNDRSFYTNFLLHRISQEDLKTYRCGRKSAVYETRDLIYEYFAKAPGKAKEVTVLFFVDRDYSEFRGDAKPNYDDVFITDHYSIENYIVTKTVFSRVLLELTSLEAHPRIVEILERKFEAELTNFHLVMKSISAWIIYSFRQGQNPIINNIVVSRFVSLDPDLTITPCHNRWFPERVNALEAACRISPSYDTALIQEIEHELDLYHPKSYTRGKYELEFFVMFLNALTSFMRSQFPTVRFSIEPTLPNEATVLRVLGPRVQIPESLREFIERKIQ